MQLISWEGFKIEVRRKSHQRTLSLRVAAPGHLRVSCSRKLPLREIFSFIQEKKEFIAKQESHWVELLAAASVKNFETGEFCPFLGQLRQLTVEEKLSGRDQVTLQGDQLRVQVRDLGKAGVQKALISFYKKTGKNYLSHLVGQQAERMNLYPQALSFRSQRTRWGSCSSQGRMSLNWRLVAAPSEVAKYVVVHELAHLKHQDHSSRFWTLVERFLPEYQKHRLWLRENQIQFEFLDPRYLNLF